MSNIGLYGMDITRLMDFELQRDITRRIEQAADAMKYGGPGHAQMYREDLEKLMREQERRRHP